MNRRAWARATTAPAALQFVVGLVRTRLGGDVCSLVHVGFTEVTGREVCRIVVEPAERPVYCVEDSVPRFFLRVGKGTRELNVREAVEYIGRGRGRPADAVTMVERVPGVAPRPGRGVRWSIGACAF